MMNEKCFRFFPFKLGGKVTIEYIALYFNKKNKKVFVSKWVINS
jgi:hypothetical protein